MGKGIDYSAYRTVVLEQAYKSQCLLRYLNFFSGYFLNWVTPQVISPGILLIIIRQQNK